MNQYSTHLPVFERLFGAKQYPKILEFGMGFGSTPFLLKNCESLTSVEMQSEKWYQDVCKELGGEKGWRHYLALGAFAFQGLEAINEEYNLVFVDGHGDSRPEVINLFFGKCDTIVTHDFETSSYRWNLIRKPSEYARIVYTELNPYTAIFTRDPSVKGLF